MFAARMDGLQIVSPFGRVLAPASVRNGGGFTPKDLTWILENAPAETLVLKPDPA